MTIYGEVVFIRLSMLKRDGQRGSEFWVLSSCGQGKPGFQVSNTSAFSLNT